jgi:hypothetical protein
MAAGVVLRRCTVLQPPVVLLLYWLIFNPRNASKLQRCHPSLSHHHSLSMLAAADV